MIDLSDLEKITDEGFNQLIKEGFDVNAKNQDGDTLLHLCDTARFAEMLLKAGANVNEKNYFGDTPISLCNDIEIIQTLVNFNADVNSCCEMANTPLHGCLTVDKARLLLKAGADPTIENNDGDLPYQTCYSDCKKLLKDAYEDAINKQQKERILEAVNEETPIEHKPTQKRRRM